VTEFYFVYHSIVGLLIERWKFVNLQHLQRLYTKDALMITSDKFPSNQSNDELLHYCLISTPGQFIIPTNRVLGDSAYQHVLYQLKISKRKKKNRSIQRRGRRQKQMEIKIGNCHQMQMRATCRISLSSHNVKSDQVVAPL
jgi:hypothetical protein